MYQSVESWVSDAVREKDSQRLLAYDYLLWHLGGRTDPRTVCSIGDRIGCGHRDINAVINGALNKCRKNWD